MQVISLSAAALKKRVGIAAGSAAALAGSRETSYRMQGPTLGIMPAYDDDKEGVLLSGVRPEPLPGALQDVSEVSITPEYFRAMRVPLKAGRLFDSSSCRRHGGSPPRRAGSACARPLNLVI